MIDTLPDLLSCDRYQRRIPLGLCMILVISPAPKSCKYFIFLQRRKLKIPLLPTRTGHWVKLIRSPSFFSTNVRVQLAIQQLFLQGHSVQQLRFGNSTAEPTTLQLLMTLAPHQSRDGVLSAFSWLLWHYSYYNKISCLSSMIMYILS